MKYVSIIVALFAMAFCMGCAQYRDIPVGFKGKILTPNGWEKKTLECGQIDIGETNNGQGNKLILIEVATNTVKETFTLEEKRDDRITLKNGSQVEVDIYVRAIMPSDDENINYVTSQVVPQGTNQDRVQIIDVTGVYNQFAHMDARGDIRSVFSKYETYKELNEKRDEINDKLTSTILKTFKANKTPLTLQNVRIANIIPDESVTKAANTNAGLNSEVQNIDQVGAALKRNPDFVKYQQWKVYQDIANSGKNVTFVINGGAVPTVNVK